MIELPDADRLPIDKIVTRQAILAEPSFVLVFVAGDARGRYAQVCPVQILCLDRCAFLRWNVTRGVALVASQAGMLSLQ